MNIEQIEILTTAIDHPEDGSLTTWEYDWCESIAEKEGPFGSEYSLSPKEVKILERINDKLEDANLL